MTSLRVRIGEPPVQNGFTTTNNSGIHIPPEFGWMVDMTFDPLTNTSSGLIDDGTTNEPIIDNGVTEGLFDTFKITAIQGIGAVWEKKLNSAGIVTIGELAALNHNELQALCLSMKSHRIVEFHSKATLSQAELPLLEEFYKCQLSILDLALTSVDSLNSEFNSRITDVVLLQLINYSCLMVGILRDDVLGTTKLCNLISGKLK